MRAQTQHCQNHRTVQQRTCLPSLCGEGSHNQYHQSITKISKYSEGVFSERLDIVSQCVGCLGGWDGNVE